MTWAEAAPEAGEAEAVMVETAAVAAVGSMRPTAELRRAASMCTGSALTNAMMGTAAVAKVRGEEAEGMATALTQRSW